MDTATAAAMSDPERNRLFRRRWRDEGSPAVVCAIAGDPDLDDALAVTGLELLEQWRRERVAASGRGAGERDLGGTEDR